MGRRGPAPTPTRLLQIRNSKLVKYGDRDGEVQYPPGKPSCPAWLSKEAKAEWRRQVKQLENVGMLHDVDRALLVTWCEAWGELVAIVEEMREWLKTASYRDLETRRLILAKNAAVSRLLRLAQQFGWSPSARVRLKSPELEPEEETGDKSRFFRSG